MVSLLHIDPAPAGIILAAVRVVDIALDTWIGMLSDHTRSRWGRRRPWLLAGSLLCPTAMIMLFNPPAIQGHLTLLIYIAVSVMLFYTAYSIFSVPHMSMPVEISDQPDGRARLMSLRAAFGLFGAIAGIGLGPQLVGLLGGGRVGFSVMSLVMAAIAFTAMMTSFAATRSARVQVPTVTRGLGLGVLKTPSFAFLLATKFLAYSSTGLNATVGMVFHSLVTRRGPTGFAEYGIGQACSALTFLPIWVWLAKRYDSRRLLIVNLLIFGAVWMSWASATPQDSDMLFYARCAILGVTATGVSFLAAIIVTECTDDDMARTGLRREGTMAGLFIATEKLAFATNPLVAGLVLQATGFRGGQAVNAGMIQSPAATTGVIIVACLLPATTAWLAVLPALGCAKWRLVAKTGNGNDIS